MPYRSSSLRSVRSLALAVAVVSLAGCGGEASKYSGKWSRDLYGEGEVRMNLASNGNVELMLPSPRWPDSVDMKGRGAIVGGTRHIKADNTGRASHTAARNCPQPGAAGRNADEPARIRWPRCQRDSG